MTSVANGDALIVRGLNTVLCQGKSRLPLVRGVDFDLRAGRTTVLLGESGSGKSISARSLLRLTPRSMRVSGSAVLDGTDLLELPERHLPRYRGSRVGMIPQDPSVALDPFRKVGRQILEVLRVHKMVASRAEGRQRTLELLSQVGIPDPVRVSKAWPHELSGGMKQRVAIAIGISCRPAVLIADEPTTALDVTVQAQILRLIKSLQDELGTALLFITHDVGVAREIADDVAVMYAGVIVEHGPAAQVLNDPTHPYTAALLAALPGRGRKRGELLPIPGQPPSPADATLTGCRFAPRCTRVRPECTAQEPELLHIGADSGHAAACVEVSNRVKVPA
ncbi:MAG: peptide/nickel transport system ATP-binding protein [Pseudonocardiales bacterium]|jgi:oligopeptide/dipeptide ABC transporter ATP-binding protein|nr:peptide/nickel transport system ATP-binding protein [Pseudonocardiales bacterium]